MASYPIIWLLTSACLLIYMVMIQGALRIWIYIYDGVPSRRSILYKGSSLWNKLPPWVKDFRSLNDFKHNFRLLNGWIHPDFIVLSIYSPISYPILMLLFYCLQLVQYIHTRNLSQSIMIFLVFIYDLYLWMYVSLIFMYLTCSRTPWKYSIRKKNRTPHPPVFKFSNLFAPPLTSNPGSALEDCIELISFTDTEMSSFCQNFHHWFHQKLAFWQLPVQIMTKN